MSFVTKKVHDCTLKVPSFFCEKCDYVTNDKRNFKKHCLTAKHKNLTTVTVCDKGVHDSSGAYNCSTCGKTYESRNGLWYHSKRCGQDPPRITDGTIDTNVILELIRQNKELQQLLVQQANENKNLLLQQSRENAELINKFVEREPGSTTINNTTNNNNNQKFNLNFFLNETCKDAMNIQEFVENLQITFQDLLKIGNDGFVVGVSDIFIKELRDLDISKRPIHCTDSKRDTIYLKENDSWNRDDHGNSKLKNIIERVEYKNVAALHQWCQENPDSKINNTDKNLLRDKIYLQTLQGDDAARDKIIKNISKEVVVEK